MRNGDIVRPGSMEEGSSAPDSYLCFGGCNPREPSLPSLPSLWVLKQRQRKYGIVLTLSRMHLRSNIFLRFHVLVIDFADDGKGAFGHGDRFCLGFLDRARPERFPIG